MIESNYNCKNYFNMIFDDLCNGGYHVASIIKIPHTHFDGVIIHLHNYQTYTNKWYFAIDYIFIGCADDYVEGISIMGKDL